MIDLLAQRLDLLSQPQHRSVLAGSLRGIEKENLRVTPQGSLALTPHPQALGSALTHPQITTDYSEALLEFVTSARNDAHEVLGELADIHRFVYSSLEGELLWNQSMPATLPDEADIPIGWYGTSHSGMLKHVYRKGLALRYGKAMQCIAGIHYNFSLDPQAWLLLADDASQRSGQAIQSDGYIGLIRNFSRYSWLLMYLFGASPALSEGFLQGRPHNLERIGDDTLYLPWATSLRMSDLGYQNKAQSGLKPCYTDLASYVSNLYHAVNQPWADYERIGTHQNGEWVQLSTHILQIENEYYSSIRPKRIAQRGERPLRALKERGVQYVEVRCMDINPFEPLGIDLHACRFLDAFLLMCALDDSPCLPQGGWCMESAQNFASVVKEGRKPGLTLQRHGEEVPLIDCAHALLDRLALCAAALDDAQGHNEHTSALRVQREKVDDVSRTPSARLLDGIRETGLSFHDFSLQLSQKHAQTLLTHPPHADKLEAFRQESLRSIAEQTDLETNQSGDFDTYVKAYHASLSD